MSSSEQQPRRKRKPGCLQWVLGVLILLVILASCGAILGGDEDPASETAPEETTAPQTVGPPPEEEPEPTPEETEEAAETITLEVAADGPATVMWGDLDGSTNTEDFTGSWSKDVPATQGTLYTVSVYPGFMSGTTEVTCTIREGGEVVDTATGTGENGSAYCTQPIW